VIIGFSALAIAIILTVLGFVLFLRTKNPKALTITLVCWLVFQLIAMYPLRSAITVNSPAYDDSLDQFVLSDEVTAPENGERPPRVLVAIERELWDPLMDRLVRTPWRSGDHLPIPAYGNELTMGSIGVLNGYTPLVTERWYQVAHEYAASGLTMEGITEASGRLRATLSLMGTDALVCPETFTGGEGFEPLGIDIGGIFPDGWHVLETPDPAPYVSIPDYVEVWRGNEWGMFKHWIVQEDYVPGRWACVEMDDDDPTADLFELGEILSDEERIETEFLAWTGFHLDRDANPEIMGVERLFNGSGQIAINARCDSPFWLVIRESAMPGWIATVDGERTNLYVADYLFIGVPVEAGEHEVVLTYRTPGLDDGMMVSGVGWVVWLVIMLVASQIPKLKKQSRQ
jgi:hypothetical protein